MSSDDKVTHIPDIALLPYEAKHVAAHRALVHKTADVQMSVYVLEPGGRIPSHRHTTSWDLSYVVQGNLIIRFSEGDRDREIACASGAMNLVPPGTVHEICNASSSQPARFLLIQSPAAHFDFLKAPVRTNP